MGLDAKKSNRVQVSLFRHDVFLWTLPMSMLISRVISKDTFFVEVSSLSYWQGT